MSNSKTLVGALAFTAGAVVGGIATYLTVKKHFQAFADKQIEEVTEYYRLVRKSDGTLGIAGEVHFEQTVFNGFDVDSNRMALLEEEREKNSEIAEKVIGRLGYANIDHTKETPETENIPGESPIPGGNIFDNHPDEDEDAYEVIEGQPQLISLTTFMNTEVSVYDKITLTYFAGDDILADERDQPIHDVDTVVGIRHLQMFGKWSEDKALVYVRNDAIRTDFEIIKRDDEYVDYIAGGGFSDEPKQVKKSFKPKQTYRDDG